MTKSDQSSEKSPAPEKSALLPEQIATVFSKYGFDISQQAVHIIMEIDRPLQFAEAVAKAYRDRKFCIAGGDVIHFLITKRINQSLKHSVDLPLSSDKCGEI